MSMPEQKPEKIYPLLGASPPAHQPLPPDSQPRAPRIAPPFPAPAALRTTPNLPNTCLVWLLFGCPPLRTPHRRCWLSLLALSSALTRPALPSIVLLFIMSKSSSSTYGGSTTSALSKGKGKGPPPPRPDWSRMQSTTRSRGRCSFAESNYSLGDWQVPLDFDYTKSTCDNYTSPIPVNDVSRYQSVRATRDHDYHGAYTRERQLFQGELSLEMLLAALRLFRRVGRSAI